MANAVASVGRKKKEANSPPPLPSDVEIAKERYFTTAKEAGCPLDQIINFWNAGIILQPRQLCMAAAARECDNPDGPTEVGGGGARGGGKTVWGFVQIAIDDCQRYRGLKFLFLRKVAKAARESIDDLRRKCLKGIPHHYNKQEGVITFPQWDSRIVIGHFQNESDIDLYLGMEYDGVLVEEATTLTFAKYMDILSSVRSSKPGWRPRAYSTSNPGGVGHVWYKERFVTPYRLGRESTTRFVPALPTDNAFLNPEYIRTLDSLTGWKKEAWRYGDWDIAAGQYFTNWRHATHVVKPFDLPDSWTFWLAIDYGFTHYTVVHVLAKDGDGTKYCVAEHAQRGWLPKRHMDAIHAMLGRIRTYRLSPSGERIVHGLELSDMRACVTGPDCFARKQDGGTIAETYKGLGLTLRAAVSDRVNGASELLSLLGDVDNGIAPSLFVFDTCARVIETIPYLEHDPHHPEDVLKVDVDESGKGGDDSYDCFIVGTPILTIKGEVPIEKLEAGTLVWTRGGWRKSRHVWNSRRNAPVVSVQLSNGKELTCTPNHRFWVENKGWCHCNSLRYGDILLAWEQTLNPKSLSLTASNSDDTPSRDTRTCVGTTTPASMIRRRGTRLSTRKYGKRTMGKCRKGSIFTTGMKTHSTTPLTTSNALVRPNTISVTEKSCGLSILHYGKTRMYEQNWKRHVPNGIDRKMGENGTVNMLPTPSMHRLQGNLFARNVVSPSPYTTGQERIFAVTSVSQNGEEKPDSMMLAQSASNAGNHSRRTNTLKCATAPVYVQAVTDSGKLADTWALEVEEHHEYFAAGVLVKNSLRYAVMEDAVTNGVYTATPVRLQIPFTATGGMRYHDGHMEELTDEEKTALQAAPYQSMPHMDEHGALIIPDAMNRGKQEPFGSYDFDWWKRIH